MDKLETKKLGKTKKTKKNFCHKK